MPVRFVDGRTQRRKLLCTSGLRYGTDSQVDRAVPEHAGGLSGPPVSDDPRRAITRLTCEAGKLERPGIGPRDCCVFARDEDRPIGNGAIERLSGVRAGAQEVRVGIVRDEPRQLGVVFGVVAKFGLDVVDR